MDTWEGFCDMIVAFFFAFFFYISLIWEFSNQDEKLNFFPLHGFNDSFVLISVSVANNCT